jgi:hypothetical protein
MHRRYMKRYFLLLSLLLFTFSAVLGATPITDVGSEIPTPPASSENWMPPPGPKILADVTQLLFDQGMADPRGCEYRLIKVMTGSVWGNYDGHEWTIDGTSIQTHGWVLPATGENAQRFAVCWNGWVYPVLAVGDPCSVDDDVKQQLHPLDKKNKDQAFRRGLWAHTDAIGDEDALSYATPLPIKAVLLMRIGKTESASALWEISDTNPNNPNSEPPKELREAYGRVAREWLFSLFNRAICAQMRGDDDLALVSFRQLARIAPGVKKSYDLYPNPSKQQQPDEDPFDFLKDVPSYLADMERRRQEPPRPSALSLGPGKFPDKAAWIKALIADLENVRAEQDGQPGWVRLDKNATIKAIVQEGNDAVDPLIDCLEHDNRYTRSVHFWRDFAPYRTVLGTHEAAYTALTKIFKTNFFDVISTGQDLTNSGPAARAKVVAAIRAYWQKRKGTSVEEQWFITLADDQAKPEEWAEAAQNIAKSGQSLREKQNPNVTALLKKRLMALSTQDMGNGWRPQAAPQLADALLTWAGLDEADAVRNFCNAMAARYNIEKQTDGIVRPLIALTERLAGMGDQKILDDYAGWLTTVTPEEVGDFQVILVWFKPLWGNSDRPALQKAASLIFTDKNSAWVRFMHEKGGSNEGQALLRSPLIGVPGFRQMLLAGLADHTQVGESGYLVGNFWMVRYGFGENGNQVMSQLNPHDPLSKLAGYDTFRACDLYAWGIGQSKAGLPALEFYWPVEKRDQAVKQAIETLQHYGERYRITAANPARQNYAYGIDPYCASLSFPKLDHPATPNDVQQGLAIFSLPVDENARIWVMPQHPLNARWLAIRGFSHNAGHSDATGRNWTTVEYENLGHVWQIEEGFIDGKWQRFYGFTGDHCVARAPAEEIEFPMDWHWQELDRGFDCQLETNGNYYKNPFQPGTPFPITLKLRNRRGVDQDAPETLYHPADKALASGLEIHLYHKMVPGAAELVKETPGESKTPSGWEEVSRKVVVHFQLPALAHTFAPMDELEVLSCDLGDFYDLSKSGEYYVEMTFAPGTMKFTGGISNRIQFFIK